jgi:hypothetical protein
MSCEDDIDAAFDNLLDEIPASEEVSSLLQHAGLSAVIDPHVAWSCFSILRVHVQFPSVTFVGTLVTPTWFACCTGASLPGYPDI